MAYPGSFFRQWLDETRAEASRAWNEQLSDETSIPAKLAALGGMGDAALTIGGSMLTEARAGLAGLGARIANETVGNVISDSPIEAFRGEYDPTAITEDMRQRQLYTPQTAKGAEYVQNIGQAIEGGVEAAKRVPGALKARDIWEAYTARDPAAAAAIAGVVGAGGFKGSAGVRGAFAAERAAVRLRLPNGRGLDLMVNPDASAIARAGGELKTLRAADGTVYAWDPGSALHARVAEALEQQGVKTDAKGWAGKEGLSWETQTPDEAGADAMRLADELNDGADRLEGLPATVKFEGRDVPVAPYRPARAAAQAYRERTGIGFEAPRKAAEVDPKEGKRIADAYEQMPHAPDDPEVQASYNALIDETLDQWREIEKTGLKVEFIKPGQPDPYPGGPRGAIEDVRQNNHLWVYPTDIGYGEVGADLGKLNHPMLRATDVVVDGKPLLANDVFRIVHDYFGHIKEGNGFRANGEETAWRQHAAMYSEQARGAMTSETRGQNSWLNWGPYGEKNRTANTADTKFAEQKAGLLPREYWSNSALGLEPKKTRKGYKLFRVDERNPGQLFPLYVNADQPVPMGQWVRAQAGEPHPSGKGVKSKIGQLAYRPGWHAGAIPQARHIGENRVNGAPTQRRANEVWAEVDMADDYDWQSVANSRARIKKNGEPDARTAHIDDQVPYDGSYNYKTNSNMEGDWIIGGDMRVNRILSDDEVAQLNAAAGREDLPRAEPFNFERYGFEPPKPMQAGDTTINVGLNVGDKVGALKPDRVRKALEKRGINLLESEVLQSNTERTLVAKLSRPLTADEANLLSRELKQDSIAQRVGDQGELYGPKAADWGPFNPEYFVEPTPLAKMPVGVQRLIEKRPELRQVYERIVPYLQEDEIARLRPQGVGALKSLLDDVDAGKVASANELAEMASLGRAKRGWYENSAEALVRVFGKDDSPRFAALLAALSPQTSVESNLTNALRVWKGWTAAGRPTDERSIMRILGENVQGDKGEGSVLDAWRNNSISALQHPDPRNMRLSGPKVNSFAANLRGMMNEITNDTWMAEALGVTQDLFSGTSLKGLDPENFGGKSIGYLFSNALTREAADVLTKATGVKWTPAEVQETVWSWVKTVVEKRRSEGVNDDILTLARNTTDAEIAGTPDFATLLPTGEYGDLLRQAGYGERLDDLLSVPKAAAAPTPAFGGGSLEQVAARLERQYQAGKEQAVRGGKGKKKPPKRQAGRADGNLLAILAGGGLVAGGYTYGKNWIEEQKAAQRKRKADLLRMEEME